MTELLVFGATSLIGSHFVETCSHPVRTAGRSDPRNIGLGIRDYTPVDLRKPEQLRAAIRDSPAEVIINFAGATDVDGVERERPATIDHPTGSAYQLNVEVPRAMAETVAQTGKRLITLSTDFVFDGQRGPYAEGTEPDPFGTRVSWYGWTKGAGERAVREAAPASTVLRVSYPYRSRFAGKLDFARKIIDQRKKGTLPPLFTDQQITPTWIPDISRAIERLVEAPSPGIFHIASPESTTPWEFGTHLIELIEGSPPNLGRGSMVDFLARPGVTPRPLRGGLAVGRMVEEGIALTGWKNAVGTLVREGEAT